MDDLVSLDVASRYSDAALARILRAVIETRGRITDSLVWAYEGSPRHTWPLCLRVRLPRGTEDRFRELVGRSVEVAEPPIPEGLLCNG